MSMRVTFHKQGDLCLLQVTGDCFFASCKTAWLEAGVGRFETGEAIEANVEFDNQHSDRLWLTRQGDTVIWSDSIMDVVMWTCYKRLVEIFGEFDNHQTGIRFSDARNVGKYRIELVEEDDE